MSPKNTICLWYDGAALSGSDAVSPTGDVGLGIDAPRGVTSGRVTPPQEPTET